MTMLSPSILRWIAPVILFFPTLLGAEQFPGIVVFSEPGFPTADSAPPSQTQLRAALPGARFSNAEELGSALKDSNTRLVVFPYGSAFPEQCWSELFLFLQSGGNLLVLGGRPFTRSAYHDSSGWRLRDYSVRFTRPLMIDQYYTMPGSDGLQFEANGEQLSQVTAFQWGHAFSPIIRLSAVDLYRRGGSAGSPDSRLDPLAWGTREGRKLAAPVVQIDHWRNGFSGGRWIFVNAEIFPTFYDSPSTVDLIRLLAVRALGGAEEFYARPEFPLYLEGEPIQVEVNWHGSNPPSGSVSVQVAVYLHDQPQFRSEVTASVPLREPVVLPAPKAKGLYVIEAKLREGGKVRAIYHSAFWIRDESFLRSGPRMTVNHDYFELDGQPLAVVGTTYMSSEVQRLYFDHPNVYVWDQDLAQIHTAGLNMIRTGWWTGWDKICDETGRPYERTMRTLEAYLMTARRNGLPVQFNFLAFLPEILGGTNPYLDPEAVRRQQTLITSVVARFRDVPGLAWDLINEPSISQHLWTMRPNGDPIELEKWNAWLAKKYPDRASLAAAWNLPSSALPVIVPLPEPPDFTPRGMYVGHNSLKVYDFFLFAQEVFADWVRSNRDAIRATGSRQLITVGQDEGGNQDRLSPAFWGQYVDFTTNHSWWQDDYVLWDSLAAKQPNETLLIQETGLQRGLNLDETARRTPENEAALLERKIAASFIQASGAIEWLWNTNSYMTESNETPIGAVLPDGTEKPEATLLRAYAKFSPSLSPHLRNPRLPSIAIVTSQAAQFSVMADFQLEAQRKAVRALTYDDHLTAYVIAENQIEELGAPTLVILPSPQALSEPTWLALLKYVQGGGSLLITGPVEEDEHWHSAWRAERLKLAARSEPLTIHDASVRIENRRIPMSFDQQAQNWLEILAFDDGSTFKEEPLGKGRIFWSSFPLELADGTQPAASLYASVAGRVGIAPAFDSQTPLLPGVLVYPIVLDDSVMYVMISDAAQEAKIDLRDKLTGTRLALPLSSQHAAIAVIGKREKAVIAKYGF